MSIRKRIIDGDILLISFASSESGLDIETVKNPLVSALEEMPAAKVVVDCTGVRFMNSLAIGSFVVFSNACQSRQVKLKYCNFDPNVRRVLDLTRLITVLPVTNDLGSALKELQEQSAPEPANKLGAGPFLAAAEQGDSPAQFEVGRCYEKGLGVPLDLAQAFAWYTKAANQNHAEAQYCLGRFYAFGIHTPRDFARALAWYARAADNQSAEAQYELGFAHEYGLFDDSAKIDIHEAMRWYAQAAALGHQAAVQAINRLKSA